MILKDSGEFYVEIEILEKIGYGHLTHYSHEMANYQYQLPI